LGNQTQAFQTYREGLELNLEAGEEDVSNALRQRLDVLLSSTRRNAAKVKHRPRDASN
jgi:hypothetical protein